MAEMGILTKDLISTNVRVYYQIAQESIEIMRKDFEATRKPKNIGEPGYVLIWDHERTAFKSSLVAIVFCGVFIEPALHLLIAARYGKEDAKRLDRKNYEEKLKYLGCKDKNVIQLTKKYLGARREIVHEKAYLDSEGFRIAQEEAEDAIKLVKMIVDFFELEANFT